jgi:hypothetical protein
MCCQVVVGRVDVGGTRAEHRACSRRAVGSAKGYVGAMKRVLLTGMSGTGKSTVINELSARGYKAVDTDYHGLSELVTAPQDQVTGLGPGRTGSGERTASKSCCPPTTPRCCL